MGCNVPTWTIYLYLRTVQHVDRQTDLDPRPRPATVQPIRACPEDPWGPFSSTSALEASPPGRRRQRSSIGRQSRSLQAWRLTLHRPVLNPDPALCPGERLSPALAVNNTPSQHKCSPQAWHNLLVAVHLFHQPPLNDPVAPARLATAAKPVWSRPQPGKPVAASTVEVEVSRVPLSSRTRESMFEHSLRSDRRGI